MMRGFHNPYNFISTADRDPDHTDLGDREPTGHDRLHTDLWTGTIDITLTTVTPLLIPDKGTVNRETNHWTFGTRTVNDHVDLPATTVKGTLRAAYETVTNSRMGVFVHDKPLSYRSRAQASDLRPVMVNLDDQGSPLEILSTVSITDHNHPDVLPTVAVPTYESSGRHASPSTVGGRFEHGQKVSVWAELVFRARKGTQVGYHYWRAAQAWHSGVDPDSERPVSLGDAEKSTTNHTVVGPWALIRGVFHRTNQNMSGKHDERLFPLEVVKASSGVEVGKCEELELDPDTAEDVWQRYQRLLADYVATHRNGPRDDIWNRPQQRNPWEFFHSNTGGRTKPIYAWSRHLYQTDEPGQGIDFTRTGRWVTCYGTIVTVTDAKSSKTSSVVTTLYPVLISRDFYQDSPADLLSRGVGPACAIHEASPADRLFGWVSQDKAESDSAAGFQGALRVGPVNGPKRVGALRDFENGGLRLDILSGPKPAQGRFYVGQERDGRAVPLQNMSKAAVYRAGGQQVLRGRKVYPHQPHPDNYWTAAGGQEFRRPGGKADEQNQSILSWVNPGTEFSTTLHVRNLTDVELGALLLVLTPKEFGVSDKDGLHRIGGGKPLGFGSTRIDISGMDLHRGRAWRVDLMSLGSKPSHLDPPALIRCFLSRLSPEGLAVLEDARRAAVGFAEGIPVHYPRSKGEKKADGKSYEWFMENERARNVALPHFGTPLPEYDSPEERKRKAEAQKRRKQQRS